LNESKCITEHRLTHLVNERRFSDGAQDGHPKASTAMFSRIVNATREHLDSHIGSSDGKP
jgi:hypothetical protein